ncbi:MAG TPA: MBG domain-containing protein, partial [Verrucomicrobiae bacterium]|nr:MBG domain-containing protein [Verrucomicrobiae bacterium]
NIYGIESLFSDPPVMYVVPFSNSVVSLNGLTRTYDGGPKPVTVTTIPAGLSVVVTYNGLSTLPVNAGQYQVVATVVDPVYTGSASNTLTITKAPLTILFGNLDWNYDGTPKSVQVQITPAVNVDLTYNDSPTPPTQPGTYVVVALVDDPNYQGAATNLMTITYSKPTPPLTAPAIPYPDNQTLDAVSQLSPVPQTLLTWPRTQNRLVLFQSADLRTWVPLTNTQSSANSITLQQTSSTRYYRAEELAPAGSRPVPLSIRTK